MDLYGRVSRPPYLPMGYVTSADRYVEAVTVAGHTVEVLVEDLREVSRYNASRPIVAANK